MAEKPMNRNEFEALIIAKAWKDPEFHKQLLADPKATFEEMIKEHYPEVKLPASLKINVVEEKPNEITLVLPVNPADLVDKEISDEELEGVAGGTIAIVVAVAITAAVTINAVDRKSVV